MIKTSALWRLASITALSILCLVYFRWQGVSPMRVAAASIGTAVFLLLLWLVESRVPADPPKPPKSRDNFDWGMHYVRGFAIVCILLTHFLQYADAAPIGRAFFKSSTVYFLFISGYLCQYLAMRRPVNTKAYYLSKLKNVIAPYVVFSVATIAAILLINGKRPGVIVPSTITARSIPNIFLLGWAQRQYWYIPFIAIVFLFSPWLTRTGNRTLVWLSLVSFALAICFPFRPPTVPSWNLTFFLYRFVYFMWAYFFGFAYARWKKQIDPFLGAYAIPALLMGVVLGLCMMSGKKAQWLPPYFLSGSFAMSFQKFLFLVPILYIANKVRSTKIALFDMLATYSFTLFFLHYFFVKDYVLLQRAAFSHLGGNTLLESVVLFGLALAFVGQNLLLSILLKKACGRWSRSFIGS